MAGYHKRDIQKGQLGEISKIREEFEEFIDANEQGAAIMELVELSDLLGAIESYTKSKYNIGIYDLTIMSDLTKKAFREGVRGG